MSVSKDVQEAAEIDGCTHSQAMWNVTVPLMRSSFVQCLFLSITRCFVVYDVNLSLTKGEPFGSFVMAAMHVYNQAFTYKNYGLGQAEAVILFFDMNNPVMRTLPMIADAVVLNLLTLL